MALGPEPGAAKFTVTPLTAKLPASRTNACKAVPKAVLMAAVCGEPAETTTEAGGLTVLVRAKRAEPATPATVAVTLYGPPPIAFAVAVTLATPAALVTAEALERVALAPEPGTAKFTVTPDTRLLAASRTVVCNAVENALLTEVVCEAPPVALTEAAGPARFVSPKLTEPVPGAEAPTL